MRDWARGPARLTTTMGLARAENGLDVCAGGPWERFAHRVDSSIKRDLMVAVKP